MDSGLEKTDDEVNEKWFRNDVLRKILDLSDSENFSSPKNEFKVEDYLFDHLADHFYANVIKNPRYMNKKDTEDMVFGIMKRILNPLRNYSNSYSERFDYYVQTMQSAFKNENAKRKSKMKELREYYCFDSNNNDCSHFVHDISFSIFEILMKNFRLIPKDVFEKLLLSALNEISSESCVQIGACSHRIVNEFNMFLVDLIHIPDFFSHDINPVLIRYLLRISDSGTDITPFLHAIKIIVSMNGDEELPDSLMMPSQYNIETQYFEETRINIENLKYVFANKNELLFITSECVVSFDLRTFSRVLYPYEMSQNSYFAGNNDYFIELTEQNTIKLYKWPGLHFVNQVILTETCKMDFIVHYICLNMNNLYILSKDSDYYNVFIYSIQDCGIVFLDTLSFSFEYHPIGFVVDGNGVQIITKEAFCFSIYPKTNPINSFMKQITSSLCMLSDNSRFYCTNSDYSFSIEQVLQNEYLIKQKSIKGDYPIKLVQEKEFTNSYNSFLYRICAEKIVQSHDLLNETENPGNNESRKRIGFFGTIHPSIVINCIISIGEYLNSGIHYSNYSCESVYQMILQTAFISLRSLIIMFNYSDVGLSTTDRLLFDNFRCFVEIVMKKYKNNLSIIQICFCIIRIGYRYMYNQNKNGFVEFLNDLNLYPKIYASAIPFLKGSPALFIAINSDSLLLLSKYHPQRTVLLVSSDPISNINTELNLMEFRNNYDYQKIIGSYIESLIHFMISKSLLSLNINITQDSFDLILRILSRVILVEECPYLSMSFSKSLFEVISIIEERTELSFREYDKNLCSIKIEQECTKHMNNVFETKHPYDNNCDIEFPIEMKGAIEIIVEFDPKCATETHTDYLQIFDKKNGGSSVTGLLSGPAGSKWPKKVVIPSDSCRFVFHSDESTNDWGIKCNISSTIPIEDTIIIPEDYQPLLCFLHYSLGRCVRFSADSLNKKVFSADFLDMVSLGFFTSYDSILSEGEFKLDLCNNSFNNIQVLWNFINDKIQTNQKHRIHPNIVRVEEILIVVLFKIFGLGEVFIDCQYNALLINHHHELDIIVKLIFKVRRKLSLSYQKSNDSSIVSQKLSDSFNRFVEEVFKKAVYLFHCLNSDKNSLPNKSFQQHIDSLIIFIMSDISLDDYFFNYCQYQQELDLIKEISLLILQYLQMPTKMFIHNISFFSCVYDIIRIIFEKTTQWRDKDHDRLKIQLIFDNILDLIWRKVLSLSYPNGFRVFLIMSLIIPGVSGYKFFDIENGVEFLESTRHFSYADFGITEAIWVFLLYIVTTSHDSRYQEKLFRIFNNGNGLMEKVRILSIIPLIESRINCSYFSVDYLFRKIYDSSPLLVSSILRVMASKFFFHGTQEYSDFQMILRDLLLFISFPQVGQKIPFFADKFIFEHNMLISNETVNFFHVLLSPYSKAKLETRSFLSDLMNSSVSIDFQNESDALNSLISFFVIFGVGVQPIVEGGYGIYSLSSTEEYVSKIYSYVKTSNEILIIPFNNQISLQKETLNNIYPSSLISIPFNSIDFDLSIVKSFNSLHQQILDLLQKPETFQTNFTIIAFIQSFYCFLPVLIRSMKSFVDFKTVFEIDKLMQFSIESTYENSLHSIPELLHLLSQSVYSLSSQSNTHFTKINHFNSMDLLLLNFKYSFDFSPPVALYKKSLPYSFVPFSKRYFSPTGFQMVYGKSIISNNVIKTSAPSLFVGNRNIPYSSPFYWEITLTDLGSHYRFSFGFLENNPNSGSFDSYSLSFPQKDMLSPFTSSVRLSEKINLVNGDIIGVGIFSEKILFFINGNRLSVSLPKPVHEYFSPYFCNSYGNVCFSYNFGESSFVTSYSEVIKSYENFVHNNVFSMNSKNGTNDLQNVDYIYHIQSTIHQNGSQEESKAYISESDSNQSPQIINQKNFVLRNQSRFSSLTSVHNNSPVLIYRIIIPPNEVFPDEKLNLSIEEKLKLGKIGTIKEIFIDNKTTTALITFANTIDGSKHDFTFDSRYFVPLKRQQFLNDTVVDDTVFTQDPYNTIDFGCYNTFGFNKPDIIKLYLLIRSFSIRMSRYALLIFLCYYQNRCNDFSFSLIPAYSKLLTILLLELSNFTSSISVNQKEKSQYDCLSLYGIDNSFFINNEYILYILLKGLIYSHLVPNRTDVIVNLLESSTGSFSHKKDRFKFFDRFVTPHMRIDTLFPSLGKIHIDTTFHERNSVGYLPIFSPNTHLNEKGLSIGTYTLSGSISETRFIEEESIHVDCCIPQSNNSMYLKIAFIPFPKRQCDRYIDSPLGGVHLVLSLLSLIFTQPIIESSVENYLKSKFFSEYLTILIKGGFIGKTFAFEFIAPILSYLKWKSGDISSKLSILFDSYVSIHSSNITEWKKLCVASQRAVALSILFNQVKLSSTMSDIPPYKHLHDLCIDNDSLETAKNNQKVSILYQILDKKIHKASNGVFQEIVEVFTKVLSLSHNWFLPVPFPAYSILDIFLLSIHHDPFIVLSTDFFHIPQNNEMIFIKSFPIASSLGISVRGISKIMITDIKREIHPIEVKADSPTIISFSSVLIFLPIGSNNFSIEITVHDLSSYGRECVFISKYEQFHSYSQFLSQKWTSKIDEILMNIYNRNSQLFEIPHKFKIPKAILAAEPSLRDIPNQIIVLRVDMIKQLNNVINHVLKCIDLNSNQILASALLASKSSISTSIKLDIFKQKVMTNLEEETRLNLRFNRSRAALYMNNANHPSALPLLKQLIEQVSLKSIKSLKRDSVPWHVELLGEGAADAGGPARDVFSQMCLEIMHPATKLFSETPNKKTGLGNNQDVLIPNSHSIGSDFELMFKYSGVLLAISYVSTLPQPFTFASFIWGYFTGKKICIEDIYSIDYSFQQLIESIESPLLTESDLSRLSLSFSCHDSQGFLVELVPGGSKINVTLETLPRFILLAKECRIKEMTAQLEWLKEGMCYFLPVDALTLLSPWELELLICGDNTVPVSVLKQFCVFDLKEKCSSMLWNVLEKFSPEERMLFIKFSTGRMGLPPPGRKWHSNLTIHWISHGNKPDSEMPLPTSTTCSSTIRIPKYSTEECMSKKIKAAICFGGDIDADRQVNYAEIVQLS